MPLPFEEYLSSRARCEGCEGAAEFRRGMPVRNRVLETPRFSRGWRGRGSGFAVHRMSQARLLTITYDRFLLQSELSLCYSSINPSNCHVCLFQEEEAGKAEAVTKASSRQERKQPGNRTTGQPSPRRRSFLSQGAVQCLERAIGLLHKRNFRRPWNCFEKATQGPNREMASTPRCIFACASGG